MTLHDGRRADGRVYPIEGSVKVPPQPGNAQLQGKLVGYEERTGEAVILYGESQYSVGITLQVDSSQGPVQSVSLTSSQSVQDVPSASLPSNISICWGPMYGNFVHTKCKANYVKVTNGLEGNVGYELVGFSERNLSGALYNNPKYGIVVSSDVIDQPLVWKIQIVV